MNGNTSTSAAALEPPIMGQPVGPDVLSSGTVLPAPCPLPVPGGSFPGAGSFSFEWNSQSLRSNQSPKPVEPVDVIHENVDESCVSNVLANEVPLSTNRSLPTNLTDTGPRAAPIVSASNKAPGLSAYAARSPAILSDSASAVSDPFSVRMPNAPTTVAAVNSSTQQHMRPPYQSMPGFGASHQELQYGGGLRPLYLSYPPVYPAAFSLAKSGMDLSSGVTPNSRPVGVTPVRDIGVPLTAAASTSGKQVEVLSPWTDDSEHGISSGLNDATPHKSQAEAWSANRTETGAVYYYNAISGESTYEKPPGFLGELSSKCGDRIFSIKFQLATTENYPFLEAHSSPIRCISRSCNDNVSTITWKKLPFGVPLNGSSSPKYVLGQSQSQMNGMCESRPSPPSKRVKLGKDPASLTVEANATCKVPEEESYSNKDSSNKVKHAVWTNLAHKIENVRPTTENATVRNNFFNSMLYKSDLMSDLNIFRYCLGGFSERFLMLKDISSFASDQEIGKFAEQVSRYSGCSHHRRQILMARRLLVEGEAAWNRLSKNSYHVSWKDVAAEIHDLFTKTACCCTRTLTQQDLQFLRRISGCKGESVNSEDFDRLWRWVYPVAMTISREEINRLWASTSPRWIEGLISKEEVEYALQSLQKPGTFLLSFPASRSWPHADAGSLVVSYVGRDYDLHRRLLSLDDCPGKSKTCRKSLQELFLEEPELSQLGRITI